MSSRGLLLLFFAFLGLYAAGDWALPLVDRDEPRFAEASREMLERGDFIVPYFNDQVRFDKPPLIYWLQDACYKLFGTSEFAARLPSGVCSALTTVIIAVWGTQLYDARTGWRAAVIFGLCVQTIVHSHAAVADMAMIAATTASAWAGWNWLAACRKQEPTHVWWLAFWGLLAVGFLAKGPIAWIPIGMVGWSAAKLERGKRPGAFAWSAGVLLMLALVGIWGIPALIRTHGQYAAVGLGRHVVMRSVAPMQGHGAKTWRTYAATFPFYFITVWPSFFPWSLWLPAAAMELLTRRKQWRPEESYMVTGIVLIFGIFTLSWTKLPHYTLPAFPLMALLLAAWWDRKGRDKAFTVAAAGMATAALVVALIVCPLVRSQFASQQLYEAASPWLTKGMVLGAVDYQEPSLVWLFRRQIDGFETSLNGKGARKWMQQPGPRVCVLTEGQLALTFPTLDPAWRVIKAGGYDVANAHRVKLAAVIRD